MKPTLESVQLELLTKGYDFDLVFDPIVESVIKSTLEGVGWEALKQGVKGLVKTAPEGAKVAEELAAKKAAWMATKKSAAAKAASKAQVYVHPMMNKATTVTKAPAADIWAANKGAGLRESIQTIVSKLK